MKNYFWDMALMVPVEASPAFEYWSSDSSRSGTPLDRQVFGTLFHDNDDGEGSVVPPRYVLRMRIEREEIHFYNIRFESKT